MAHSQVTVYGMSAAVGPLSFSSEEESGTLYRPYSEKTAQLIDREVDGIVSASYARAISVLTENKAQLTALAEALLEKEVIGTDDLTAVLGKRPFGKSLEFDDFINASWETHKEGGGGADGAAADEAGEGAVPAAA